MDSLSVDPAECSSDGSQKAAPGRQTSHTQQSGLGYGVEVVLHHFRPFIPFVLISILVVVLVYLLQTIIYGGPFVDPHFFVKFNERWPRPDPQQVLAAPAEPFSPVPSTSPAAEHYPLDTDGHTR
ncbi:unnamed protein product [Merluccius merluccius]